MLGCLQRQHQRYLAAQQHLPGAKLCLLCTSSRPSQVIAETCCHGCDVCPDVAGVIHMNLTVLLAMPCLRLCWWSRQPWQNSCGCAVPYLRIRAFSNTHYESRATVIS